MPVDRKFVDEFVVPHGALPVNAIPRGGDLPYFFIALTHRMPLITEDRGLRRVAERLRTAGFALEIWDIDDALNRRAAN